MSAAQAELGVCTVITTSNRGMTPEELAERALARLIYVGEQSHPVVREQALAFKAQMRATLVHYLAQAQKSERTTICAKLREQGLNEAADMIGRL